MSAINKHPVFANELRADGSFVPQSNLFTVPFGYGPGEHRPEAGRYRLLWMKACPYAHRAVIVRKLLGLDKVISLGTASHFRTERGWEFSLDEGGVDPVLGIRYVKEIYDRADPHYKGRPTVPIVVDIVTGQGANSDYFRLTNYLETVWADFHKEGAPDLYPEELRGDIDALNDVIFWDINSGVYKAGFAHSQEAYDRAYDTLFARLDELERHLQNNRYLFGHRITDSDVRLYTTLARFDAAYYSVFNTNRNRLVDFPNLWGYARDLYQIPGFGDTTDFAAIRNSYHASPHLRGFAGNPWGIYPKGPDDRLWNTPHGREKLSKG
ncbi:putative glutathione S-transferase [Paenibacillus forsythiae]|uniref:Glutathione S-transferase n=2 Tax=Paenibacillus forsythiae TaxID=365616 RepID=A0ABU3H2J4_9BACL|nr:glutathione S-transferase C-terminal domain-containing protein [Paenibacillus forsythiae]MDT3425022.1 putative glutathione S-transferase [Paenibacillus forsythiae]